MDENLRARNRIATKKYRSKPGFQTLRKDAYLKKTYGISLDQYKKMLIKQKSCCAICDRHESKFKYGLYVDHNHKTGNVRGLLCTNCNTAVGAVKESPEMCYATVFYLLSYNGIGEQNARS